MKMRTNWREAIATSGLIFALGITAPLMTSAFTASAFDRGGFSLKEFIRRDSARSALFGLRAGFIAGRLKADPAANSSAFDPD